MEYFNNILCITQPELLEVMSESNYKQMVRRGKISRARRGGNGRQALIVFDSLPGKYRSAVRERKPDISTMPLQEWLRANYTPDAEARSYFSAFRFDNGSALPAEKINEYTVNASVIKAVLRLMASANALRRVGRIGWDSMAETITYFKREFGHTLPESMLRFRKKVAQFKREGYACLISGRFQNQNSRKVNYKIERLILSLDSLPERPFNTTVAEMYNQFVCGELNVYDPETGELFDPEEFTDKEGEPIALSETTVANYLNNPKNRALRSKLHDSAWDFNNRYRPHHKRKAPVWAFSKISLDDRDLPRKMADGNRVKAYYAYDVASGCVVGYAYNRLKTADLFIDCVRNMFRLIDHQGWNCPAEVEVEHHLVNNFADGLIRAGVVFPFVRWCNPGNSQEKRAEHFNRVKKYGVEKRSQVGIGRWYARLEANRPKEEKVYDEFNNTYKEATYTYEQLVADDIRAIHEYNNALHPNQKLYPGLTRWEVLCRYQNPDLAPVDKALLYRFIGEEVRTSIRRSKYCRVHYEDYALPSPELIGRLAPNDYTVEAYYLPDEQGNVPEVYIYQHGAYIATCRRIEAYNEATAEQTERDREAYAEQAKYNAQFDAMMARDEGCRREIQGRDGADGGRSRRTVGAAQECEFRYHRLGAVPRRAEFRPIEKGAVRPFSAQVVHPRVAGLQGAAEGQDGRRHPLRLRRENPHQRLPGILSGALYRRRGGVLHHLGGGRREILSDRINNHIRHDLQTILQAIQPSAAPRRRNEGAPGAAVHQRPDVESAGHVHRRVRRPVRRAGTFDGRPAARTPEKETVGGAPLDAAARHRHDGLAADQCLLPGPPDRRKGVRCADPAGAGRAGLETPRDPTQRRAESPAGTADRTGRAAPAADNLHAARRTS